MWDPGVLYCSTSAVEREGICEGGELMLNAERPVETEFVEEVFRNLLSLLEDTRSRINEGRLQEDHPSLPPEVRIA